MFCNHAKHVLLFLNIYPLLSNMNMLKNYPDVLKIKDMCEVLGGISTKTGYKLLRENKIESIKVGPEYCITKISVVDFLMRKNKTTS